MIREPEVSTQRPTMNATLFSIGERIKVAALIAGDGVDLVTPVYARLRGSTIQLTVVQARELAAALLAAAKESEDDV